MNYEEAMNLRICQFISGSKAYGTDLPDSDTDMRGVFIAPLSEAFDLFKNSYCGKANTETLLKNAIEAIELGEYKGASERILQALNPENGDLNMGVQVVNKPNNDESLYELRFFLKLFADNNPNILELAYFPKECEIFTSPIWEKIVAHRDLFLCKKCRWTYAGYAISQLNRIKTHRGYLLNPKPKPSRKDFGLPENWKIDSEHQNAILALPEEYVSEKYREQVRNEKRYKTALTEWQGYERWKKERNPKRAALEAKCGLDSKHASHCIRLLRTCKEILTTGEVIVRRPDAEELKNIRVGNVRYEKILEMIGDPDKELDELYKTSTLRDKPDHKRIAELYREICEEYYGIRIKG